MEFNNIIVIIVNMSDTKNLNKWMNQQSVFRTQARDNYLDLLSKLFDEKFEFTQAHFDTFVNQTNYLINIDLALKVCTLMFNKFDPTPSQMEQICYQSKHVIHNVLIKKNWNYTLSDYLMLKNNRYKQEYENINFHNNLVFLCCQDIMYSYRPIMNNTYKKLFNNIVIDDLTINILLLYTATNLTSDKKINFNELFDLIFNNCSNDIWTLLHNKNIRLQNIGILLPYITKKFGYNIEFCKSIILTKKYGIRFLLRSILHGYVMNDGDLDNIICNGSVICYFEYNVKYEKLGITQDMMDINTKHVCITKLYDIFKIPITLNTLTIALTNKNYKLANIILENYEVMPNKDTLDLAIKNINVTHKINDEYDVICNILKYKILPDSVTLDNLDLSHVYNSTINDKRCYIDLLINNGLILTFEVFEFLLSKRLPITNLERFGIPYDEKLYFLCYKYNTFCDEYYEKLTIDGKVLGLHKLCRSKLKSNHIIMDYLQKHNVKMDKYALDFLLFSNRNKAMLFIENYKCIPSILTTCRYTNKTISLDTIVTQYNLTHMHMFEQYDINLN